MCPRRKPRPIGPKLPEGPVILFVGTDLYQIKQVVQELVARKGGESSCERREYDATAEGEITQAIIDAASPSLLVPSRVVVLHNVDRAKAEDLERILPYIKNPARDSVLALIATSQKSPKKVLKEILSTVPMVLIEAISPSEIRELFSQLLKQANVKMDPDALTLLLDHVGDRADEALAEMEKMIVWAGPGGRIDRETCQLLLTTEAEDEVWAMTRGVSAKDPRAALLSLGRIIDQGIDPISLLGMLASQFRRMWSVRVAEEEGIPREKWSEATGLKGYPLQATIREASGFTRERLERGLARIRETDEALKGGSSSPEMALECLVAELSALS